MIEPSESIKIALYISSVLNQMFRGLFFGRNSRRSRPDPSMADSRAAERPGKCHRF